jgi:hypothetical protein
MTRKKRCEDKLFLFKKGEKDKKGLKFAVAEVLLKILVAKRTR